MIIFLYQSYYQSHFKFIISHLHAHNFYIPDESLKVRYKKLFCCSWQPAINLMPLNIVCALFK